MHLVIIPLEELTEAKEIQHGLKTLLPDVLLVDASEGSVEMLRKREVK